MLYQTMHADRFNTKHPLLPAAGMLPMFHSSAYEERRCVSSHLRCISNSPIYLAISQTHPPITRRCETQSNCVLLRIQHPCSSLKPQSLKVEPPTPLRSDKTELSSAMRSHYFQHCTKVRICPSRVARLEASTQGCS